MRYSRTIHVLCRLAFSGILSILGSSAALEAKQPPSVLFDASSAIACRVVKSPSLDISGKLIEAKFRVSILVDEGQPADVEDIMVRIGSSHRRLRVIDFFPKTEMAAATEGEVQTTHTTEKTATAEAKLGGGASPLSSLASATLGGTQRQVVAQTFKELPSKCLVLASGTSDGEHGVFFKVKGSPQVPLEGAKEFTCVFEVPKDWHGDWCVLSCRARNAGQGSKKAAVCGAAQVFVGLYLAGEDRGQEVARRLEQLQSSQPVDRVQRLALGVAPDAMPTAAEPNRHSSVRATLAGWTKLPRLFDRRSNHNAVEDNQDARELQATLEQLSRMSGN